MNESLIERLRYCTTLPTPPSIALRIIELANDPDASLTELADCLGFDPALSTKVLKAANSPLYSTRRTAGNLRQAVNMLGTHATVTIALSFALMRTMSSSEGELAFWKRAILSALACRLLAQRFELNPDDLLLAGLLQDIGILALRSVAPNDYAELNAISDHDELLQAERAKFGSAHDEVGHWLLKKWRLPDHLVLACIASHASPFGNEARPTPLNCVAASGYFADVFLKGSKLPVIAHATEVARRWLGMDAIATVELLEQMRAHTAEFENLFDLKVIRTDQADALLDEAKELVAIASLGKLRELEEKAQRDALTGTHNRMYFDEALKHEFAVSTRHGWPLSMAFIDIDHFKRINDTYGHAAGDNTLVTLSRLIASQIRSGDIFARYGGEEFVLLFPGTPREAAWNVLSRIRQTIEIFAHTLGTQTYHLTISVGLACHMDGAEKYGSAEDMLQAADAALYTAKRNGRNQIVKALR